MADELKPCPFCGCKDISLDLHPGAGRGFEHAGDDVWTIGCRGCGASTPGRYNKPGKALLIQSWNRRATPEPGEADAIAETALSEIADFAQGEGAVGNLIAEKARTAIAALRAAQMTPPMSPGSVTPDQLVAILEGMGLGPEIEQARARLRAAKEKDNG
jgi:Lar family restriction alleviation protein